MISLINWGIARAAYPEVAMKLDSFWEQFTIACYQLWVWLKYETGDHPFLAVGTVVVFILAWALFRTEVRSR